MAEYVAAVASISLEVLGCMTGERLCSVEVLPRTTVRDLKAMVELATGVPAREQKLVASASVLAADGQELGPGLLAESRPSVRLWRLEPAAAIVEEGRQRALEQVAMGVSLLKLPRRHRADPEVVLAAAERNIVQLQHAAREILENEQLMVRALRLNTLARCYASPELWSSRTFVLEVVKIDGMLLELAPAFRHDLEVCQLAVGENPYALKHCGCGMRDCRELVLAAVRGRGTALCFASDELKCDKDLAIEAIRRERMAVVHCKGGLRQDPDILRLVE